MSSLSGTNSGFSNNGYQAGRFGISGFHNSSIDVYTGALTVSRSSNWTQSNLGFPLDGGATLETVAIGEDPSALGGTFFGLNLRRNYVSGAPLVVNARISNLGLSDLGYTTNSSLTVSWPTDTFTIVTGFAVPEPSTTLLGGMGLIAGLVRRKRIA